MRLVTYYNSKCRLGIHADSRVPAVALNAPEADKSNPLSCCWEDRETPGASEGTMCLPLWSPVGSCPEIVGFYEEWVCWKYGGSHSAWCCSCGC